METLVAPATLVCPGCETAQEVTVPPGDQNPSVLACPQCRANLVVVPPQTPESTPPSPGSPIRSQEVRTKPAATTAPRSAVVAVALLSLLTYLIVGLSLYATSYGVKQLGPYKVSESFVSQHPVLKQSLGDPLQFGWFPSVQMHTRGRKGSAYVELSVSGSTTSGLVGLSLDGTGKDWRIRDARYQLEGAEVQPLWVQFPGDYEVMERIHDILTDLDQAGNDRNIDGLLQYVAPHATFRIIVEGPKGREVRNFRNREEYRREILAGLLMLKDLKWIRQDTDIRFAPDGRTATVSVLGTREVTVQGQRLAFAIDDTITVSLEGGEPVITAVDEVQQVKR